MTSKHFKWQLRWRLDLGTDTASHDTGLQVRFTPRPGGGAVAEILDPDNVTPALQAKHGGHNMPPMLARLQREALQLRAEALAGGGRHG